MKQPFYRWLTLVVLSLFMSAYTAPDAKSEFYELRTYYLNGPDGERVVDQYLEQALLPALHRQKLSRIGVFKPISNDTAAVKRIYVLIPFRKMEQFTTLEQKLSRDAAYQQAGQAYIM
ncbi:MAG TPA: NIPSNAP family containing protein, partial [Chitinophagaceae bacterium]|nr:NIPSNAP family containing protein [Chitinophagaceae bacterium]